MQAQAVAGGVLAVLFVAACGGSAATPTEVSTPSATVTAAPTASPTPRPTPRTSEEPTAAPTPAVDTGAWVELVEGVPYLNDVVAVDDGFVGVGVASTTGDGPETGALWRSDDGVAWREEPYQLQSTWGTPEILQAVAASDATLFGLGSAWLGIATSSDGTTWSFEPLDPAPGPDMVGACPVDIAAREGTVVAVGSIGACGFGGGPGTPAIWVRDPDGWTLLDMPEAAVGGFGGVIATSQGFSAWGTITASKDTWICQIGCYPDPEREPYANAPWSSTDGRTWYRAADPAAFEGASLVGFAATERAIIALGTVPTADGTSQRHVTWRSEDGASWVPVTEGLPFADAMNAFVGSGTGRMAVWGGAMQAGEIETTMVWTSTDGQAWDDGVRLPAHIRAVAGLGDTIIAFGTAPTSADGSSCRKDEIIAGTCRNAPVAWVYAGER